MSRNSCERCEAAIASAACRTCQNKLCNDCDAIIHKGKLNSHTRTAIAHHVPAAAGVANASAVSEASQYGSDWVSAKSPFIGPRFCSKHPKQLLDRFCFNDEMNLCNRCASSSAHQGHTVRTLVAIAATKMREDTSEHLVQLQLLLDQAQSHLGALDNLRSSITHTRSVWQAHHQAAADRLVQAVQAAASSVQTELQAWERKELDAMAAERSAVEQVIADTKLVVTSTAEAVRSGTDLEVCSQQTELDEAIAVLQCALNSPPISKVMICPISASHWAACEQRVAAWKPDSVTDPCLAALVETLVLRDVAQAQMIELLDRVTTAHPASFASLGEVLPQSLCSILKRKPSPADESDFLSAIVPRVCDMLCRMPAECGTCFDDPKICTHIATAVLPLLESSNASSSLYCSLLRLLCQLRVWDPSIAAQVFRTGTVAPTNLPATVAPLQVARLYCVLIDGLMAIAPAPMPLDALPELLRVIAWLMEKGPKDALLSCFRALEHIVLTASLPTEAVQTLASMAAAMVRRLSDLTGQKSPGYSPPDHDDHDANSDPGAELELRAKMLATIWDMCNRWPVFLDAVCQRAGRLNVIGDLYGLLRPLETFNVHAVSLFRHICLLMDPAAPYVFKRYLTPDAMIITLQQLIKIAKRHMQHVGVAHAICSMLFAVLNAPPDVMQDWLNGMYWINTEELIRNCMRIHADVLIIKEDGQKLLNVFDCMTQIIAARRAEPASVATSTGATSTTTSADKIQSSK